MAVPKPGEPSQVPSNRGVPIASVMPPLFLCLYLLTSQTSFALSFDVFQAYYCEHEPLRDNQHITVIGALAAGVVYLAAPPMMPLIRIWLQHDIHMIWTGRGFMIMYSPVISTLNEWFVATRSLVLRAMEESTSVSGIAMSSIPATLLST